SDSVGCRFYDKYSDCFGVTLSGTERFFQKNCRKTKRKSCFEEKMNLKLSHNPELKNVHLILSGSKSETNRLLLLQALFPEISIKNSSDAEDSVLMKKALASTQNTINIHHSGTAMRFLTAYFSIQKYREVILTGSNRMKERPIGILV